MRVDDGAPQFVKGTFGAVYGVAKAAKSGLSGESLQVIVKAKTTAESEVYRFDNVIVAESSVGAAALDAGADATPEMEMGEDHTIYLPVIE